jgi:hypothetical protein
VAATASSDPLAAGSHEAVAKFEARGILTLRVDQRPATTASTPGPIAVMPVDGLQAGADEGGAVGPYKSPYRFSDKLGSIVIEVD